MKTLLIGLALVTSVSFASASVLVDACIAGVYQEMHIAPADLVIEIDEPSVVQFRRYLPYYGDHGRIIGIYYSEHECKELKGYLYYSWNIVYPDKPELILWSKWKNLGYIKQPAEASQLLKLLNN